MRLLAAQAQGAAQATYAATFGSVAEAGRRWGHATREAGWGLRSRIHVVADGAEWITLQSREVFGAQATVLTDFYHVSEYLAAAGQVCRPGAPRQWLDRMEERRGAHLAPAAAGAAACSRGPRLAGLSDPVVQ